MLLSHFLQRKVILYFVWIQINTQRKICTFLSPAISWKSALREMERCWLQQCWGKKSPTWFAANIFKIKYYLRGFFLKVGILWSTCLVVKGVQADGMAFIGVHGWDRRGMELGAGVVLGSHHLCWFVAQPTAQPRTLLRCFCNEHKHWGEWWLHVCLSK